MMAFGYSLALVSAGSALHALWNVLVKRSGTSDVAFVWVYSAITAPLWLVVLTVGAIWGGLGPAWWAALVSTALHTAYAAVLQRAYSAADLSVVYPVSRGLAPVLVTAVVAPWTGGPSAIQTLALMAVLVGVVLASRVTWRNLTRARGLWAGGAVASCTAAYTLWDAFAVAELHVAVVPYMALSSLAQFVLLTIVLGRRRRELPAALAAGWTRALRSRCWCRRATRWCLSPCASGLRPSSPPPGASTSSSVSSPACGSYVSPSPGDPYWVSR